MTTRLLLVRHAETDVNAAGRTQGHADNSLNALGRRQAATLAAMIGSLAPAAVYSSPLQRARATAEAIAVPAGLEVRLDDRLLELDHGDLDGLTGDEMRARYPDFMERWSSTETLATLRVPGGETLGEAQARLVAAVAAIVPAHPGESVVVVSHGLALRALLCHVLGVPVHRFRRFHHDLASLSVVDALDEGYRVVALNDRCHLQGE